MAAEAIASLAENEPNNCALIVKAGAIEPLVTHLACESEVGQAAAATSLKNLSIVPAHLELLRLAGAVARVVNLLRSPSPDVRSAAAGAVMAFSADADNRKEIIDCGAIEPLVELLQTPDLPGEGKSDAEMALCQLVMDPSADKDLRRNSLVAPVLVDLVRSGGDNSKELASAALEDLSEFSEGNRETLAEASAVETLVPVLRGAALSLRGAAAKALISLMRLPANRPRADAAGVVPSIAELLRSSELRDRSAGARLVEHVSRDLEAIQVKIVGWAGVPQALLELLQDPTQVSTGPGKDLKKDAKKPEPKKVGAAAPANEAEDAELKPSNPDAEECHRAASMAICSLAASLKDHQTLFGANGSVAALVALLSHVESAVQAAAAKALTTLGQHESNQGVIVEQGAVPPLVKMMLSGEPKSMEKATECAWVLMDRRHVANQDAFAAGGIIHPLSYLTVGKVPPPVEVDVPEVEAPPEPENPEEEDPAASPAMVEGSSPPSPSRKHRSVVPVSMPSPILNYDETVTIETRRHAALAFRNMAAGNAAIRVQIGKYGPPSPFLGLVDLLKLRGEPQEAAAGAIRDVADETEGNMVLAAKNDAIGNLVEMLITGSAAGKTLAADALRVLAGHYPNIRQIINGGAIEPMVEILRAYEDDKGRSSAAAALGYLGKSSKATRVLIRYVFLKGSPAITSSSV